MSLRRCLEDADTSFLVAFWRHFFPAMPQPKDDAQARVVLHQARSGSESVRLEKRLYSHAWLTERGLRSNLPDELRPPAEQRRPIIVSAVGVAVQTRCHWSDPAYPERKERAAAIERAMASAAAECHADGIYDKKRVTARMWAARDRVLARA